MTERLKSPIRVLNMVVVDVVDRVKTDHQVHLDTKASWEKLVLQDLSVRTPVR